MRQSWIGVETTKQQIKMYKGIIEEESLNDKKILTEFEVVLIHEEFHKNEEPEIWHAYDIKVPDNQSKKVILKISKSLKKGWYSLFWNKEKVYVIFKEKIFELGNENQWNPLKFEKIVNYGGLNDIPRKWFDNMRNPMNNWGIPRGERYPGWEK